MLLTFILIAVACGWLSVAMAVVAMCTLAARADRVADLAPARRRFAPPVAPLG